MDVKEKKLHDAISDIDGRFIEEAADMDSEKGSVRKHIFNVKWTPAVVAAASLAIVAIGMGGLRLSQHSLQNETATTSSPGDMYMTTTADAGEAETEGAAGFGEAESGEASVTILAEGDSGAEDAYMSVEGRETEVANNASGICIPAAGSVIKPLADSMQEDAGSDAPDAVESLTARAYKVTLYGFFDEEDLVEGAEGYYEEGYGELRLSSDYESLLEEEADRLLKCGLDARIVCTVECGDTPEEVKSEYLQVILTDEELDSFPCAEKYGYRLELQD